MFKRLITAFVLLAFICTGGAVPVSAQNLMVKPGEMAALSHSFHPSLLTGVKVYAGNPFRFDFILHQGDVPVSPDHARHLIKYFLASLTVPEKDLWVNLSPYEKDRIAPEAFGQTEMGRDLLAQDYFLKQLTASLMYPEGDLGKKFWAEVYRQAKDKFGTADIPVDTFNKVWITPAKAVVFENKDAAYVVEAKLKVMLESDYLAMGNAVGVGGDLVSSQKRADIKSAPTQNMTQDIIRQIILPALEKEVNEGASFAPLRQVYNSLILATWYKRRIKESLLGKVYVDQHKVIGLACTDVKTCAPAPEQTWQLYVEAFKKGVYNFIKDEKDPLSGDVVPKKYFSGGLNMDMSMLTLTQDAPLVPEGIDDHAWVVRMRLDQAQQSNRITHTGKPALTQLEISEFKQALPQLDWERASWVPWGGAGA